MWGGALEERDTTLGSTLTMHRHILRLVFDACECVCLGQPLEMKYVCPGHCPALDLTDHNARVVTAGHTLLQCCSDADADVVRFGSDVLARFDQLSMWGTGG